MRGGSRSATWRANPLASLPGGVIAFGDGHRANATSLPSSVQASRRASAANSASRAANPLRRRALRRFAAEKNRKRAPRSRFFRDAPSASLHQGEAGVATPCANGRFRRIATSDGAMRRNRIACIFAAVVAR